MIMKVHKRLAHLCGVSLDGHFVKFYLDFRNQNLPYSLMKTYMKYFFACVKVNSVTVDLLSTSHLQSANIMLINTTNI